MENYYVITKTKPGNVYFELHPISNADLKRMIKLTDKMPSTRLPKDWALGIFLDGEVFSLYKKGYISFGDKSSEIKKAAIDEGVYFGTEEELAVINATDKTKEILDALKNSKRSAIIDFINKDPQTVALIAREHLEELSTGVVGLVEEKLKVQIKVDEI